MHERGRTFYKLLHLHPMRLFIIGIDVRNQMVGFAYGEFNMICGNLFRIHIRPPDKVIAEICMRVQFLVCTDYTPKIRKINKTSEKS
mgnify:CR=1 FL=1